MTLHVSGMLLGEAEQDRAAWFPWRDTPIVILAVLLIVIGFWLPAPAAASLVRSADRDRGRFMPGE